MASVVTPVRGDTRQTVTMPRTSLTLLAALLAGRGAAQLGDTFEYGGAYKRISDSIHFIARDTAAEVCEGDSFLLQCAPNTSILIGPDTDIRFGRNGVWEPGEVVTILVLLSSHWTFPIG